MKPCPFCGAKPRLREGPFTYVECDSCGASGPKFKFACQMTRALAVAKWDQRETETLT